MNTLRKTFALRCVVVITMLALVAIPCLVWRARSIEESRHQPIPFRDKPIVIRSKAEWLSRNVWAKERWSGDEVAYSKMRRSLDKEIASSDSLRAVWIQYFHEAEHKPNDAMALFRWGYIANVANDYTVDPYEGQVTNYRIQNDMLKAKSPDTYEYARLRFLTCDTQYAMAGEGERLLARRPNDELVMAQLAVCYSGYGPAGHPDAGMNKAVALAEQLIRKHPDQPEEHCLLGEVHLGWTFNDRFKNCDVERKCITQMQTYLSSRNKKTRLVVWASGWIAALHAGDKCKCFSAGNATRISPLQPLRAMK